MSSMTRKNGSHFVANPYLGEELKRSTMLIDDLESVAADILERAQANAPVAEGDFKEEMAVESGIEADGATARFIANNWKAAIIEFGTVDHAFDQPIRRSIAELGLKLEKKR